jgi:5-formyltetrahydrofolate cyclo-ligase
VEGLSAEKAALRAHFRALRRALPQPHRQDAAAAVAAHANALGPAEGLIVASYVSIGSELDVRPLSRALEMGGASLCFPRVEGQGLRFLFHALTPTPPPEFPTVPGALNHDFVVSPRGLLEPPPHAAQAPRVDVAMVPALAVALAGTRLGAGGGYYDRWLASNPRPQRVVAVIFEAQVSVHALPVEPWDAPMDGVLTEAGFRWFRTQI